MKKYIIFGSLFLCLSFPATTWAAGVGIYGTAGGHRIFFKEAKTKYLEGYNFGGGLVVDTCLAKNKIFNYRMKLGYSYLTTKSVVDKGINNMMDYVALSIMSPLMYNYMVNRKKDFTFHRISFSNSFGFGIIRTKVLRFWLGPQINLHYLNGSVEASSFHINNNVSYNYFIQFDLGLIVGLNLNFGENVTLAIDSGVRYAGLVTFAVGSTETTTTGSQTKTTINLKPYGYNGVEGFGTIAVLFRFNDSFAGKQ